MTISDIRVRVLTPLVGVWGSADVFWILRYLLTFGETIHALAENGSHDFEHVFWISRFTPRAIGHATISKISDGVRRALPGVARLPVRCYPRRVGWGDPSKLVGPTAIAKAGRCLLATLI